MKRHLLAFVCAVFVTGICLGQTMVKYEDYLFDRLSSNGNWMTQSMLGSVVIFNRADSVFYSYEGTDFKPYSIGQGNAITDDGIIVGSVSDTQPAYWQNGEWHLLPITEADTLAYNSADGITPDGRRIVGTLAGAALDLDTDVQMMFPAVWTKGTDGEYQAYVRLPQPKKDFTGRPFQFVTARSISADGKTVYGQLRDFTGFAVWPIVYTEDAEGEWSYETLGENILYKEGTVFPKWPTNEPKYPQVTEYMTEEEMAEYDAAVELYNDSVNLVEGGVITEYPTYYPNYVDFLKEQLDTYNELLNQYNTDAEAYNDSTMAFNNVYYDAITNYSFSYNEVIVSENGRYYATSLSYPDPDSDPNPEFGSKIFSSPVCFDLKAEGKTMVTVDDKDMISTSVMNDGTLFTGSPATDYNRKAWVIPSGSTKPIEFSEWLKAKSLPAYNWLKDNMSFNYVGTDYDENGNEIRTEVPDSLITGTLTVNSDGTVFSGFMSNVWSEEGAMYNTYLIDLNGNVAIESIKSSKGGISVYPNPTTDILNIDGAVRNLDIVDLSGRRVYDSSSVESSISMKSLVGKGTYLVRLTDTDGNVTVKKVSVN